MVDQHRSEDATANEKLLFAITSDRSLGLSGDQLKMARDFLSRYRRELEQIRSVQLAFLPPYIEPQTAVRWIEHGGHSKSKT